MDYLIKAKISAKDINGNEVDHGYYNVPRAVFEEYHRVIKLLKEAYIEGLEDMRYAESDGYTYSNLAKNGFEDSDAFHKFNNP